MADLKSFDLCGLDGVRMLIKSKPLMKNFTLVPEKPKDTAKDFDRFFLAIVMGLALGSAGCAWLAVLGLLPNATAGSEGVLALVSLCFTVCSLAFAHACRRSL